MKQKLITSALPYVNNVPHLGNLIQVLSADVFARYCRLTGHETLYVCGTDEYGTATETKAQEEGKTPRELCDYYHAIHKDVYAWFNIAFDYFGRTSTPQQTEITQDIFLALEKNNYINEHTIEQLYCGSCKRFLADRFVRGGCPKCGYDDARGDQCEHCGTLLDPTELHEPRCSVCAGTPELKQTTHLYIDLPRILDMYQPWMNKAAEQGQWAKNAVQITKAWVRDGLQERAITRDLKWGIPVPKKGFESKVFYVWFDAPIGYLSITKCYTDSIGKDWKHWWHNNEHVELFQFIGKDNIPFHTVIFPCSLLGSGKPWTMLHHMSSTEYLNYESGKFSKSKGVGVFGTDAKESGIPADMWRFYIFYNRPEKNDTQFTWKDFQERVNSELIGNFCNLINRSLTFVKRYYNGTIPAIDGLDSSRDDIRTIAVDLQDAVKKTKAHITKQLDGANLRDAFHEIFALSSIANKAFQDGEPWKNRTTDTEKAESLLHELCYFIKDLIIMVHPYMPKFADTVAEFFGVSIWSGRVFDGTADLSNKPADCLSWQDIGSRSGLTSVIKPKIIYKMLDDAAINNYRRQYSGTQSERTQKQAEEKKETPPVDEIELFKKHIALKTAKIIGVEKHPDADKLYIEQIDDGSSEQRVILSGLVPFLSEEELLGKTIIIADNLKPRKMRGIVSRGMLLAADYTDKQGKTCIELVTADAAPGTPVVLERNTTVSAEVMVEEYAEKSSEVTIETFFSVPILIKDSYVYAAGKRLCVNNKPIRMQHIQNGTIH